MKRLRWFMALARDICLMRWIWIDRVVELERASRCVAIKNVSAAEDVLHDHFPATDTHPPMPRMPHSLIIEGMAQTAGILVGHAGDFKEKVILAKITRADFTGTVRPGMTIRFIAQMESYGSVGASTSGTCEQIDPATGEVQPLAEIQLMVSHIDQNRSGLQFPEENFVFNSSLMDMMRQSGIPGMEK